MSETKSARILIMGCGAIGGTVAAHLTEIGADVTAVTTNEKIAAAVVDRGFRIRESGDTRSVPGTVHVGVPQGSYDVVLIATQPPQVEEAVRTAMPSLAEDGVVVVFQNGLCEERVAAILCPEDPASGATRVVGAIIAWGASMPEPGVYDRTASGGFTIGRPNAHADATCHSIGYMLEVVGPVQYTDNLSGARWSKLALNCGISSLPTIAGERLGPLVRVRRYRRLALEIFTEVVAVARAEGIALEKVAGTLDLDWIAMSDQERTKRASAGLTAKHALLLAVGLRYRRMRSSMLQAIERGRLPSIDFLNGEIATRGAAHDIATPVNALVVETVHAIARGELTSSRATLDSVFEQTRS